MDNQTILLQEILVELRKLNQACVAIKASVDELKREVMYPTTLR